MKFSEQERAVQNGVHLEAELFKETYLWFVSSMPSSFLETLTARDTQLIVHHLVHFKSFRFFAVIDGEGGSFVLCPDDLRADERALRPFAQKKLKSVISSVSKHSFPGESFFLYVAYIRDNLPSKAPCQTDFYLPAKEEMKFSYELKENEGKLFTLYLVWRDTDICPSFHRISDLFSRYGLRVRAMDVIDGDSQSIIDNYAVCISFESEENAVTEKELSEIISALSFINWPKEDLIETCLVEAKIISSAESELLKAIISFIHQFLIQIDAYLYSIEYIEEVFCKHPELSYKLLKAFSLRLDPSIYNIDHFEAAKESFLSEVAALETGQKSGDIEHKCVFFQAMNFVSHVLKTNFYCLGSSAIGFRIHSAYFETLPFDRSQKFPEIPYGVFFIKGAHFFSFHIRFKDLSRGGLRTVCPENFEQMTYERDHVLTECYNLALTQQKKNKDIPEGGSKAVIFLEPTFAPLWHDVNLTGENGSLESVDRKKTDLLYRSQRHFIESLLTLVNCDEDGKIKEKRIVDYWRRPEYLYLGPDENMHDSMIEWIAKKSREIGYKPGGAFISSKPSLGFNHKEFGVTSLGVNVYLHKTLEYFGINPTQDVFRIKMTGGPGGDVAGNELLNLYRCYPETAKLVALTDGTGTIRDEKGLNLKAIKDLFEKGEGISLYPKELLSEGGFSVIRGVKRGASHSVQETLCYKRIHGEIKEEWLSENEAHHILRMNVHETCADVFIPAGGRPRTLNGSNIFEFLDPNNKPTASIIIEGANLYLDNEARSFLEQKGVLIVKDSSANKGGVICSSFEVLSGLTLSDSQFLEYKDYLVEEILQRIRYLSEEEANLLLKTHRETQIPLTKISDMISVQINRYTYELLDFLDPLPLPLDPQHPWIKVFLNFALPTLKKRFQKELLEEIPSHHKKAIIASYLASSLVYKMGVYWVPSIVDILPVILQENKK